MTEIANKKLKVGNVPNLRFSGFEGEWEEKKLGEMNIINPKNENLPNSFIYIDLESVVNGRLLKEEMFFKGEAPSRAQRRLVKGDILFQMVRPYQKNNLYFNKEGDYVASTGYAQIRTLENSQFVFQYLHNQKFVDKVIERCTGTSYPAINSSDLGNIKIHYPNSQEQNKIASFLKLLDKRIQTQMKIIENLETLIKKMSEELFTQKTRFKKDLIDWEVKKLREICKVYDGTHQTPNYVDDGIPFYSVEHLTANQFDKTKFISEEVFEKENKRVILERGDILMTRIGSIGVAKYINWDVNASFYVSLALIKKSRKINNEYLCHFMNSSFFQSELWKRTIHVAFPQKINLGEIGDCLIKIPSFTEQTKIANFLSSIDEKIKVEKSLLQQYESQKKYLLANLFV